MSYVNCKALTHENSLMNHIGARTFTVMMLVMFSLREWRKAEVDVKACWFCKETRSCSLSCKNTLWFSQVLISTILQVEMGVLLWGEPAQTRRRSTFEFASVHCPANLIEMLNNALASHIYRVNVVLSVFVAFFRGGTAEVCAESLRFETGSLLSSDNDTWQAPSTLL